MVLRKKVWVSVTGFILFLFGVIMAQFWEDMILARFYKEIPIKPGTLAYKRWTGAKEPIKSTFYFWNWTNPEQITDENIKPHFVEMGPYIFWQFREKVHVTYNRENATVSYRNKYSFYFDPDLSNGTLSDEVTSINTIAASAAYMTRTWSKFLLNPISAFLRSSGQQVWWKKKVGELLFTGFENPVQKLSSYIPGFDTQNKFAYFYNINSTDQQEIFNIDSGENDVNKIGQLYFLNYKNESDAFPECKDIKGTNGELFPPFVSPKSKIEYYIPEICRKGVRYFDGESNYKGLKTYTFSFTAENYDRGRLVPENKCYYKDDDALPPGVHDLSRCKKGPPIATSLPHFLHADPYYRNKIEGMNPDKMKHSSYSAFEPTTGVQVNMSIRVQINVRLSRNPGLSLFTSVPDVYIPVLWEESEILMKGIYLLSIQMMVFFLEYGCITWYGISGAGFAMILFVAVNHLHDRNSIRPIRRSYVIKINRKDAKKGEEQKLKKKEAGEKKTVKYVISDDKKM